MTIANVTTDHTFDEWRTVTNQLIGQSEQAFSVAVASFNSSNVVVGTAANVTANLILSNTSYMNAIVAEVVNTGNVANLVAANTIILGQLYLNANTVAGEAANATANLILLSPAYINTVVSYVVQNGNVANLVMANTMITNTIYQNANTIANSFFVEAVLVFPQANTARDTANLAFDQANAAYAQANSGLSITANLAFVHANAAFTKANTANNDAIAAFTRANVVNAIAVAAFVTGNQAFSKANTANNDAIASFLRANVAYAHANAAFLKANTSSGGGTVTLYNDTVDATRYVAFANTISGNISGLNVSSTGLTFNPFTGTLNATIFNSLSDETKKENIQVITDALIKVQSLRGVTFNFIEGGNPSAGIIAQDLIKIMPELVDEKMSVTYSGVIGLLVEAIKELSNRVTELENK